MDDRFTFNGVDARTGAYVQAARSASEVASWARHAQGGDVPKRAGPTRATRHGVDPRALAEAGWAVLAAHDTPPAVLEALRPLLERRRAAASGIDPRKYRELVGAAGVRPGESKRALLERLGAAPAGAVQPERLPYYVLIVGGPASIPFETQALLDVQYAVGRIDFDSLDDYSRYAKSVVAAESGPPRRAPRVSLFGTCHADDPATALSSSQLLGALADSLVLPRPKWSLETCVGAPAGRERLAELVSGTGAPALLFAATHGIGFPCGDPLQRTRQGALLCQQWPGPEVWRGPIPPEFYYSADDVGADVSGLMALLFACYGGGTPAVDATSHHHLGAASGAAPKPFVAALPQRLLSRGALAVVAQVGQAWSCSFTSRSGAEVAIYASAIERLLAGDPIGLALEPFGARHAELAAELATILADAGHEDVVSRSAARALGTLWTAATDARNFILFGDPAVRLPR